MGVGSSVPSWQGELVHDWPRYRIRRTPLSNGEYAIVVFSPDGVPALSLTVVPFKTPHGYVSQAAGAPFSVAFQLTPGAPVLGEPVVVTGHTTGHTTGHDISVTLVEGIDVGVTRGTYPLRYDPKAKKLFGLATYSRRVTHHRGNGPSDTSWRMAGPAGSEGANGLSALPRAISIVNAYGRVCVWRGDKPADASEAAERGPTDLLARILSANNGALLEDGASRGFEVAVEPELARNMTAAGPAVLSFFLAMATEAFWSQGASCHAAGDMDVGTSATPVAAGGEDVRRYRTFVDKMIAGNAAMQRMTRGD